MLLRFVSVLLFVACSQALQRPIVRTSLGAIEGQHKQSYHGRTFSSFEGIPFAKPPTGYLRFKEPVRPRPWTGTLNATTTYTCMQVDFLKGNIIGDEDCLYLNVYVPKETISPTDNLDVVVHIHGGAFMYGSAQIGGPKYFMDRDVVYVNLNYRLGVLGFLSTEDNSASGNFGMKDQVLALQWIQMHINQFGGNPDSVTITGLSAGAGSVHLHYFSKLSRGLFHRGVSNSGNALAPWAIQEGALDKAKKIASLVGCNDRSTDALVNCMRQRSAKQLVENMKHLYGYPGFPLVLFAPVVESRSPTAFLDDYPYELLQNDNFIDVPWIQSVTAQEGSLGLLMFQSRFDVMENGWNDNAWYFLDYNNTVCDSDKQTVSQQIKHQYFGNKKISRETLTSVISLFGDRYFIHSFEKSARMHADKFKSPVYSYIYEYKNSFITDHEKNVFGITESYGVGHGEDGQILYSINFEGVGFEKINLTKNDEFMQDTLLDIIISFAATNVPNVKNVSWNPITKSDEFSYLYLGNPQDIKIKTDNELAPTEFWDNIPIMENEDAKTNLCKQ